MAITNATTLADYAAGISTQNATLKVDSGNKRVGIGTTNPKQTLQVGTAVSVYGNSGIVSATAFYGDGANLTNVGVDTTTIVATNFNVVGGALTVSGPEGGTAQINLYSDEGDDNADKNRIINENTGELKIQNYASGSWETSFKAVNDGATVLYYDNVDKITTTGYGLTISGGACVSGVTTSLGGLVGALTGNVTGNASGTAGGLSGTPDITVRNITGVAATFTGAVTYEDVTNVDSIGIVTARGGLEVGAAGVGGTISSGGNVIFAGITTVGTALSLADNVTAKFGTGGDLIIQHNGTDSYIDNNQGDLYVQTTGSGDDVFVQPADALYLQSGGANTRLLVNGVGSFTFDNGTFIEKCNITAGKLSGNQDIDLLDGMVHYFSTQETTTATPNLRESASRTLGDACNTGDVVTVTLITTAAAAGYSAQLTIDGNTVTEEWVGGSAPSAGSSDGLDIYTYTCIRIGSGTGDSGWKVIANLTNASN